MEDVSLPSSSGNEPFQKNWLMFLLHPIDLLQLLNVVSNPTHQFAAGTLPPDVHVEDAFYDEGRNQLGMMLESELFEPVEVRWNQGLMQASWPRAIFHLNTGQDKRFNPDELWSEPLVNPEEPEAAKPFVDEMQGAAERGFHLRALTLTAEQLLSILKARTARDLPLLPIYPPNVHILGAVAQEQIKAWTIFIEHADFEPCKFGEENDLVYVEIPGDGEELVFRIGLPGARLKRGIDLDLDAM